MYMFLGYLDGATPPAPCCTQTRHGRQTVDIS